MRSNADVGNVAADVTHDAGCLVSGAGGQRAFPQSFDAGKIGMAQPRRAYFNENFFGARRRKLQRLYDQRLAFGIGPRFALFVKNGGTGFRAGCVKAVMPLRGAPGM